jgi:hypothetical protein
MSEPETSFLQELDREIRFEWKYERRHRLWMWGINWSGWITRLFLLAFGWYRLTARSSDLDNTAAFAIAFLSMLNIALPLLNTTFRFQQRQEVHDTIARDYSALRIEFVTGQITLAEAVRRFAATRRQPTEKLIRGTP